MRNEETPALYKASAVVLWLAVWVVFAWGLVTWANL